MKNFKKILELISKTGDRFIFEDEDRAFVVISAQEYENLVIKNSEIKDLSEQELLNKINKDIAVWRDLQKMQEAEDNLPNLAEDKEKIEEEDQYYFEPSDDEE
ncbi:MAG: hypothetical protein PHC97_04210 [Patescibacteria group bacterium]|nr:hypothetical protein [Patescibacteria group bacterium]